MSRFTFSKNKLIHLPAGVYLVKDGIIIESPIVLKEDIIEDSQSIFIYGINDYLIIQPKSLTLENEYKVLSKYCELQLVDKTAINVDLLIKQVSKIRDLQAVLCQRKIQPTKDDAKNTRVYALFEWIDKYFYDQPLMFTHSNLAAISLSTRVTLSRSIKTMRQLNLIAGGRARVKISKPARAKLLR